MSLIYRSVRGSLSLTRANAIENSGATFASGTLKLTSHIHLIDDKNLVLGTDSDGTVGYNATQGGLKIAIPDNNQDALRIGEAANTYMTFDTQDGSEEVLVSKRVDLSNVTPQNTGVTSTAGGAGNSGKILVLDSNGKADGRVISTDGGQLDTAYAARPQKLTKSVGHADLTDAGTTQTIDFDSALPATAFVLGGQILITTKLAGGTVTNVTVKVGAVNDDDGINTSTEVGPAYAGAEPGGVRNNGVLPAMGSLTPKLAFTSVGGNLVDLTAGSLTFTVYYVVV